jgi:hypothetical protein
MPQIRHIIVTLRNTLQFAPKTRREAFAYPFVPDAKCLRPSAPAAAIVFVGLILISVDFVERSDEAGKVNYKRSSCSRIQINLNTLKLLVPVECPLGLHPHFTA